MSTTSLTLWTPEQTQLIATTIAPGCTGDELRLFAYACQRTGLDPFIKQIYAIKRKSKQRDGSFKEVMSIQVSIDGMRSIAARTGELDGSETFWCGEDGVWTDVWLSSRPPAAAKSIVYRRGCSRGFTGVARSADYNPGQSLWNKMPAVMIAKCSEALALRKAFPADLSGVYSQDEMEQSAVEPVTVAVAGDDKLLQAGKAAIARANTHAELDAVRQRMEARSGQLSDEQRIELVEAMERREQALAPALPAEDPLND